MAEINLPFSIIYKTEGITPIADVIDALKATDVLTRDAISLLPSLIDGLEIQESSLNVRALTQESPLRELFLVALIFTFQEDLNSEVPMLLEDIFNITVSDKYDSILTIVFLIVLFYGISFAKDAAVKLVEDHKPRKLLNELVDELSRSTGKTTAEIMDILTVKFSKAGPAKRLLIQSKQFFLPSQKSSNAPILIDRKPINSETIREIPYAGLPESKNNFDRFESYSNIELELHAMDKDKLSTGWAAIAKGISDKRMKMKVMEPVMPQTLWGLDTVVGDIVVVSKLTADGYVPSEIHLLSISN